MPYLEQNVIYIYTNTFVFVVFFVCVGALRPIQQCFSHVGTEPPLSGFYQYFLGGK